MSGLVLGLLAAPGVGARAADPVPCTETATSEPSTDGRRRRTVLREMPGGDWATYGADLRGTQRQDAEHDIGVGTVGALERAWSTGDTGYQSPAPIVAGGCVFINTGGHIDALDLETGELVWRSS